jgi:hypothetical protein
MPNYDTGAIRNLLTEVFPDADEIEFFCDDYFKEIKFEADMALKKRAHALTQYCAQNNLLDKLLALVQKKNPTKYADLSSTLLLEETSSTPAASPTPQPATPQAQQPSASIAESVVPIKPEAIATPSRATSSVAEPAEAPQGQDVFISYSTKNLDFVASLYQQLTRRGLSVWFDKRSLEGGTQWRESIVNGIIGCKVFLLVLSPKSVASDNVRKEVDLAEHHNKKILPLMWEDTSLPPSFQYQLAGTQYVSFHGMQAEENFNKIAEIITKLLGGSGISEAAAGEQAIQAAGITNKLASPSTQITSSGRPPRRGTAQEVSPIATGIGVMTKVVNRIVGFTIQEKDANNMELEWLFVAAEHFLKIRRGEVERTAGVPVDTPSEAETTQAAKNATVLASLNDFSLQMIESQIQGIIKQINIYMRNLAFELDKQAQLGGEAGSNIALKNSIDAQQKAIIERTQELAEQMQKIYGVKVYAPDIVAEKLP